MCDKNIYKYYYSVYGLHIKSNIEINEFLEYKKEKEENDQITIDYGIMDCDIKKMLQQKKKSYITKNRIWFHIPKVASYLIENGNRVIIEPCENHDKKLLRVYILGSVMGFLMLQRNKLAIHGGAILINNNGVIISGERGAGKSTLVTHLVKKGYKFISDDVAAITVKEDILIDPGFPFHKLCADMVENMNYDKDKCELIAIEDIVKYIVPDLKSFMCKPTPVRVFCELTESDVEEVSIEKIKGNEKLLLIMKHIYRGEFLCYLGGISKEHFKQCLEVAKKIEVYKITRPRNKYTVQEQVSLVEKLFDRKVS
ncbi:hypothetical protein [Oceanirhabdus sp. W0125-5]|uniref:hypothetical protein n=1 Tax=Oceanirhabdus sp. W0125-5 TaxID=2999116 RepID=UPI0022F2EF93|nr:hypothetical protein [Oceanirhabdus sp. W0125-5]WBW98965.1 hypothetical protein OW730_09525 [Oceanirhabdus sp. W0125-5]